MQAELQCIFSQQYTLTIQEVVEVRYRTVTHTDSDGNSYTEEVPYNYYILYVTLKSLGTIATANLTAEKKEMYDVYRETQGNKPYLFEGNPYANAGSGEYTDYDIPPEALTDERLAAMIAEAEKYLGYPYVWGGVAPAPVLMQRLCMLGNQSIRR